MWEIVTALAAVVAICVSAITIVADGRRTRRSLQFDLLTRLVDRFESPAFEVMRSQAARHLLDAAQDGDDGIRAVDGVLNFFETVAFYQQRGALDREAIWHTFGVWILPYCILADDYMGDLRKRDGTSYEDLAKLQAILEEMEQRRGGFFAPLGSNRRDQASRHLKYDARLRPSSAETALT